ncbi:uncharacterized protein LOC105792171 isoform X7 [Gossypium raimondii]|uniref:RanBD1 domain-containing protein n=1 Tax=Gossypium raimondii TaxID=29730 RepID=A0A0D2R1B0_GOSRA|nr:uncharacterized protein LOC105792171 isoform X7 [Gossypium raimondii]KJB25764.1 hypothetical protein B456_004G207600 [Gossypium raimondii]
MKIKWWLKSRIVRLNIFKRKLDLLQSAQLQALVQELELQAFLQALNFSLCTTAKTFPPGTTSPSPTPANVAKKISPLSTTASFSSASSTTSLRPAGMTTSFTAAGSKSSFTFGGTTAKFTSVSTTTSFTSSGMTTSFATPWSSGLLSNIQTPVLFGIQSSVAVNNNASDDADEENELPQPSSPSVKKSEEKGIVIVHEVKCKLYVKSTDPADKDSWKDKGTGQLSIKRKEGGKGLTKCFALSRDQDECTKEFRCCNISYIGNTYGSQIPGSF